MECFADWRGFRAFQMSKILGKLILIIGKRFTSVNLVNINKVRHLGCQSVVEKDGQKYENC